MKHIIFSTSAGYAPLFLRLFIALVIFPHGAQKLLGWFGGFGFTGTMQYFTQTAGLPWVIGLLVIIVEFVGPLALAAGFATRFWALAMGVVMLGIIITNFSGYFFMNWFGNQKTEGAEYFLLIIGMCISLVVSGAGNVSVDRLITK